MGDSQKRALRIRFDGKLRLEFHGAKLTSDAELLPLRELDEAFRLTEAASLMICDFRRGKSTQHTPLAMLRQAVYGRLPGCQDVSDAERLRVDPATSEWSNRWIRGEEDRSCLGRAALNGRIVI